ncbi:MAG: hypothetical protein PHE09_14520 [Oscillospiraceae bacterium]|nr:hypothetical protein [Oscillospiraceae bacterium]
MTDKELHKLKRVELLQMMVSLSHENEQLKGSIKNLNEESATLHQTIETLQKENQALRESATAAPEDKKEFHSVPEAACHIEEILAAAQKMTAQCLEAIQQMGEKEQEVSAKPEKSDTLKPDAEEQKNRANEALHDE